MGANAIGPNYVLDQTWEVATGQTITGYQVVRGTAAGTCEVATADDEPYLGVAQLDPNDGVTLSAGDTVRVRMMGISKVQVSAAVAIYNKVAVTTGGGMVDDATPGTVGDHYLGVALEAGSQLFDIITVDLTNKNSLYAAS